MAQPKKRSPNGSATKIIPPKKKMENLSRDEVRSINKKRIKRRRKFKKLATLFLLAFAVLCVGALLALTVFFKINTIKFTGERVYSDSQILEQSGIEKGKSLFSVNEEKLNELLPRKLPYIKSVKVARKLPDTLTIEVTATREAAAFISGAGYVLVDDTGKVLDSDASMLRENVAIVSGIQPKDITEGAVVSFGEASVNEDFTTILSTLSESGFVGVTEIVLTDDGEFKLIYENRITIKLGSTNNLSLKLQRAKAAIDKEDLINPYAEGVLDLKTEPYAYFRNGADEEQTIPPEFVTDEQGEAVTDENGEFVTIPAESLSSEESTQAQE